MPNSASSHTHEGSCHCGAIEVSLSLETPLDEIQPRACQCDFCTRRAGLWVSDPRGSSRIAIDPGDALSKYRFGHGTADFIVCAKCGTSVAAIIGAEGDMKSVTNVRGLAMTALCELPIAPADFDSEEPDGRMARRYRNWTPTTMQVAA